MTLSERIAILTRVAEWHTERIDTSKDRRERKRHEDIADVLWIRVWKLATH
jgi:hypothetical protein